MLLILIVFCKYVDGYAIIARWQGEGCFSHFYASFDHRLRNVNDFIVARTLDFAL